MAVSGSGRVVLLPPPIPGDDSGQTACLILRASRSTPFAALDTSRTPPLDGARSSCRWSTLFPPTEHVPPADGACTAGLPPVRGQPACLPSTPLSKLQLFFCKGMKFDSHRQHASADIYYKVINSRVSKTFLPSVVHLGTRGTQQWAHRVSEQRPETAKEGS